MTKPTTTPPTEQPPARNGRPGTGIVQLPARELSPGRALLLPGGLAMLLASFALLSTQNASLARSFLGAAGFLLLWTAALYRSAQRANRPLTMDMVLRPQHWLQACAQATVLLYWGWHARIVYTFLPLIVVQLIFAYAFDALLQWTRHHTFTLGFGPFPVIFSINLFLWFKLDWFYWQFVMIAVGFAAKEFIRWNRAGRAVHIFNPSSFPLAVASVALLLASASDLTYGDVIAHTQADTPNLYLVLFLVSLGGQVLFGVARMTLAAALTMYVIGLVYLQATGTFLFYDSYIPVQVFLGMHLLFTDPSTSPRSESGRILFGVLYALGTIACYVGLQAMGAPAFYDKLLPVPIMNLLVRSIDRLAQTKALSTLDPARIGRALTERARNLAYTAVWAGVFIGMSVVQGVGDRHPGQYLPFWQKACAAGSDRACRYERDLTAIYCRDGSGWACNEVGVMRVELGQPASGDFQRSCELGFSPGCENSGNVVLGSARRAKPMLADLPIVLRGTKPRLAERDPEALNALACAQGWAGMCDGTAGARTP